MPSASRHPFHNYFKSLVSVRHRWSLWTSKINVLKTMDLFPFFQFTSALQLMLLLAILSWSHPASSPIAWAELATAKTFQHTSWRNLALSPYGINEAEEEHLRKRGAPLHGHGTALATQRRLRLRLPKSRFLLMSRAFAWSIKESTHLLNVQKTFHVLSYIF